MATDLEKIKGLENAIGKELSERPFDGIEISISNGYAADRGGNVTGLNLDKTKLEKSPASLSIISTHHHLKNSAFRTLTSPISPSWKA